jgi:hypothetical protein
LINPRGRENDDKETDSECEKTAECGMDDANPTRIEEYGTDINETELDTTRAAPTRAAPTHTTGCGTAGDEPEHGIEEDELGTTLAEPTNTKNYLEWH